MKLKKVEILGFKSFAEKTVIEFHEGITCIVGPNGCGKSNIGDALRWVLGEQSAKAMRGGKMPDVIFAGASSKKPLNFAEATVYFSEVAGSLAVDYEELAITRRLHRNGESEYLINKNPVRLKDIHSLFLDSGIGKNNISFFEQGKIDQLIQYSPEERRYIFEEAAGIVRFLQRKRETFRKLEEVNLNLTRVDDIIREIVKQIDALEGQAAAAAVFKEKKHRLEFIEKEHLIFRYRSYERKQKEYLKKEADAKQVHNQCGNEKNNLEKELFEKKNIFERQEKECRRLRDCFLTKQSQRDLKIQSMAHADERLKNFAAKEKKILFEMESLKEKLTGLIKENESLASSKVSLEKRVLQEKQVLSTAEEDCSFLEKEIQNLTGKQTSAYQKKVAAFQKQASYHNEVKQLELILQNNREKKEQLEVRSKNLLENSIFKEKEVQKAKQVHENCLRDRDLSQNALQTKEKNLQEAAFKLSEHEKSLQALILSEQEVKGKLKALLNLRNEFAGFTSGAKKLLQQFSFLKGLYEYITPKKGREQIISDALKPYAETLVVISQRDFEEVVFFAKEQKISDFSLLCLQEMGRSVDEHLLGDVILKDDGFIDSKKVHFFPGKNRSSVFMREAEIKSLEKNLEALSFQKDRKKELITDAIFCKNTLKQEKIALEQKARSFELKAIEASYTFKKASGELSYLEKEKKQTDEEVLSLVEKLKGIANRKQEAVNVFSASETDLEIIQNQLKEIEQILIVKNPLLFLKKEEVQKQKIKTDGFGYDLQKNLHQLHLLDAKKEEMERFLKRLEDELSTGKKEQNKWIQDASAIDLDIIEEELKEAKSLSEKVEAVTKKAKAEIGEKESRLKSLEASLKEMEGKIYQAGIQLAHVETGQSAVLQEMKERFSMDIGMMEPTLASADGLEKEMEVLRGFLQSCQNVNLAAIEECEKQKQRHQFLSDEVADLSVAKQELLKVIGDLDKESRALFKETFNQVRTNFQKNFQILFKGGEADLELLESEDVLEAGVEITAKPPGKQMRSLSLLSGGEKCLTAMALLFAIFEVKSSPFCVLDEIDAPLDDSNVERFLNVVKQFIDRCQFIIVTHNKRTMALADRLYGVSMEEKGISKILFMEFSGKSTQLVGV